MATQLKIKRFIPQGEFYHFARPELTAERAVNLHCHDFHEVFWMEEGHGWHWINGGRRELRPGKLVLVRAPDAHGFSVASGRAIRIVNVAFHCSTWRYLRARYFAGQPDFFGARDAATREFELSPGEVRTLQQAARELDVTPRGRVHIERFLLNLLCARRAAAPGPQGPAVPDWLRAACLAISDPAHFERGTRGFAALAHHSPEHVAREVRRWLGRTPTDIVNEARMAHAAGRLAASSDPILEISLECGFENLSHFYRLFAARFGSSPRQYRLRQQRIVSPA